MAKTANGGDKNWRARMAEGLRAARAARNGASGPAAGRVRASLGCKLGAGLAGLIFLAAALTVLNYGPPPLTVRLGTRVRADVRARVIFHYSDPDAFNDALRHARNTTPTVYRYDPGWAGSLATDVDKLVEIGSKAKTPEAFRKQLLEQKLIRDAKAADPIWKALDRFPNLKEGISKPLGKRLNEIDEKGVLSDERWKAERLRAAKTPDRAAEIERRPLKRLGVPGKRVPFEAFYSPENRVRRESEVREDLQRFIRNSFSSYGPELSALIERLVLASCRPSLQLDKERTEAARKRAVERVGPAKSNRSRKKDAILLRAGDEIGPKEMLILRAENRAYWNRQPMRVWLLRLAGLFLTLAVLMGVTLFWIWRADPEALGRPRQLAGLGVLGLGVLALAKAAGASDWPAEVAPVVFFAMVAAMVFSTRTAAALAVFIAALAAVALGGGFGNAPILVAGALTAALVGCKPRHRLDLLKAALVAGLISAVAVAGWRLLELGRGPLLVAREAGWALGAALAQGLILAGALPVLEAAFGTTTSISLLELCDQNHPLLKALFLNAPGSHQHSMVVGMLSETGAEAVGADPLLARAGSYYHDIGKIARPEYFVENAPPGQNRHDRLGPSMSAMVVIAHVRDGAELAREYRLPRSVIDVIEQHHGTTLAEFFFRRAAQRGDDPAESVYRYAGPKPQTKEAAIVLLADAVEAASRALEEPSVARLNAMVHELANRRLLDGQFDDSGLTLGELAVVEAAFTRILISMFHARVAYPAAPEKKKKSGTAKA